MNSNTNNLEDRLTGCLLGTAVGDALGLAREGLPPDRAHRMFGHLKGYEFFFKKGMISDDTEHTCMVLQSLIEADNDVDMFLSALSVRIKRWLILLPAGVGWATLKSTIKAWMGYSYKKSGVYSAGNGAAMRSAIMGVYYHEHPGKMKEFVYGASLMTHTDPRAYLGALVVAQAAAMATNPQQTNPLAFYDACVELLKKEESKELPDLIKQAVDSVINQETTANFALSMGLEQGVTGYVYFTVPVAIHAWLSNQDDYKAAVKSVIECGGDTDSTAAIVGGIVGSHVGLQGIPKKWILNLIEWPRSVRWMQQLAQQAGRVRQQQTKEVATKNFIAFQLLRNFMFIGVIFLHAVRRLFPPY